MQYAEPVASILLVIGGEQDNALWPAYIYPEKPLWRRAT